MELTFASVQILLLHCVNIVVSSYQNITIQWRPGSVSRVGALLQEKETRNMYQCENLCKVTSPCLAVSYSVRTRMCSLFREVPVDENISPSNSDIRISDIREMPEVSNMYRCQNGTAHVKNGNDSICLLAGVACGTHPVVPHADVTDEAMTYNSSVTYVCRPGYRSDGSSLTTRCTEDGSWSLLTGSCTIISCGQPADLSHAEVDFQARTFGSTATYTCDEGYVFDGGNPTIVCSVSGDWSELPGSCERKFEYLGCYLDDIVRILDGSLTFTPSLTKDICIEMCNNGKNNYAGLENYYCICGVTMDTRHAKLAETECSFPCTGDTTQICGGWWRISLYKINGRRV